MVYYFPINFGDKIFKIKIAIVETRKKKKNEKVIMIYGKFEYGILPETYPNFCT